MAALPASSDATARVGGAQPEQVLLLSIRDRASLAAGLEALKDWLPMFGALMQQEDYEGHTIHSFSAAAGLEASEQISYTLTRDQLIVCVGHVGYLQQVLTRLDADAAGLWQAEDTRRLLERIAQPAAVSRSYSNLTEYLNILLQTLGNTWLPYDIAAQLGASSLPDSVDAELHMV